MLKPRTIPQPPPAPRRRRQWLAVAYDITDDKRRLKVMHALAGYGRRVQYSVFECEVRSDDVDKLRQRLADLIDDQTDDVRIYLLCENCLGKVITLGRATRHALEPFKII